MGGLGSGRRSGTGRATVEMCRSIDVNRLNRSGVLAPGWLGAWEWTREGAAIASIGIRGGRDSITLVYRSKVSATDWRDVVEPIAIRWRSCRLGGVRPLFVCPGQSGACGRKVTKLYAAGRFYLCRHCNGLTYASCNETRSIRAIGRSNRIRKRLGGVPGMASSFPDRPRRMWRRTYERLKSAAMDAEATAQVGLAHRLSLLLKASSTAKARIKGKKRRFWA